MMVNIFKILFVIVVAVLAVIGLAHIAAILKQSFVWLIIGLLVCTCAYLWFKDKDKIK